MTFANVRSNVLGMKKPDRGGRKSPLDHDPDSLRWALGKSGLSQKEFADAIGKSAGYVSEILNGTRNAHPALLLQMARALNCPVVMLEAKRQYSEAI